MADDTGAPQTPWGQFTYDNGGFSVPGFAGGAYNPTSGQWSGGPSAPAGGGWGGPMQSTGMGLPGGGVFGGGSIPFGGGGFGGPMMGMFGGGQQGGQQQQAWSPGSGRSITADEVVKQYGADPSVAQYWADKINTGGDPNYYIGRLKDDNAGTGPDAPGGLDSGKGGGGGGGSAQQGMPQMQLGGFGGSNLSFAPMSMGRIQGYSGPSGGLGSYVQAAGGNLGSYAPSPMGGFTGGLGGYGMPTGGGYGMTGGMVGPGSGLMGGGAQPYFGGTFAQMRPAPGIGGPMPTQGG